MTGRIYILIGCAALGAIVAAKAPTTEPTVTDAIVIDSGQLPARYRDWRLISVAREAEGLDDIRAILGNDAAIEAYREAVHPFPEGAIIARLAWAFEPSAENNKVFGKEQSFVAGEPKNGVQFMIKDSVKYATTGGWGYFQFDSGKPLNDKAMLQSCFDCHQAIQSRDFVFTRYAH